jgi:Flp pilus assembly protein TadG
MERMREDNGDNGRRQLWRGVVLAEAAIVILVLSLVTLGALQYGWFFYCLHTATNAARQGARAASVLGGSAEDGTTALRNNLLPLLRTAAGDNAMVTQITDATGRICMKGEVTIPNTSAAVRLLPIAFLPVPNLHAAITMAKEGAG